LEEKERKRKKTKRARKKAGRQFDFFLWRGKTENPRAPHNITALIGGRRQEVKGSEKADARRRALSTK